MRASTELHIPLEHCVPSCVMMVLTVGRGGDDVDDDGDDDMAMAKVMVMMVMTVMGDGDDDGVDFLSVNSFLLMWISLG